MPTADEQNIATSPLMPMQQFIEGGYLSAVNVNVLHPVGLALSYDPASGLLCILDGRDDPEGVYMGDDILPEVRERLGRFNLEWARRVVARRTALGYVIQPLGEDPRRG